MEEDTVVRRLIRLETRLCRGFEYLGLNVNTKTIDSAQQPNLTVFELADGETHLEASNLEVTLFDLQKFCESEDIEEPIRVEIRGRTLGIFYPRPADKVT